MIVMELLENGDLQNYLLRLKRKYLICTHFFILLMLIHSNTASPYQLLNFCRQICLGMTYLSGKGFIHCDLAARNVLLSKENICKVRTNDNKDITAYIHSIVAWYRIRELGSPVFSNSIKINCLL